MNQIVSLNTVSTLTMSSREIAELTGKAHFHVKRDISSTLLGLHIDPSKFGCTYRDGSNRQQTGFALPKRETLILVSGYSVELRASIIDRWMELEEQQITPITATEVSTMMAKYMADIEETIVAPLVKIVADLIHNKQSDADLVRLAYSEQHTLLT